MHSHFGEKVRGIHLLNRRGKNRIHPGQKRPLNVNDVIQIGNVQMKVKV